MHPDIGLVAVVTRRPDQADGLPAGIRVLTSVAQLTEADRGCLVVHTTHALGDELAATLLAAARAGADIVTSSGLFHPSTQLADGGEALDRVAKENGTRIISSGLQPGTIFEVLPALVLDLAPGWREVVITKPSDARSWPVDIRHMQGMGESLEMVEAAVPYPLGASAHLLADALGLRIKWLQEKRTAMVSSHDVTLGDEIIRAGAATGSCRTAWPRWRTDARSDLVGPQPSTYR